MPKFTPEREQEIRGLLADLKVSGQSVADLAHDQGVAPWTVYSWRKRFSPPRTATRRRRSEVRADLVEIAPAAAASPAFELVIGDTTVRLPMGFDADELARIVRVVRSC